MKTRFLFVICVKVVLLITFVLYMGCSDDEKDSITNTDTDNHTIVLINGGTNTTECTARQFTRVELNPVQDASSTISKSFVSNPNTTINIELKIPETDTYKITFFVAGIDSCIWWDSIALEVGGTTNATLSTNNMGFHDNSYVASIRSSGDNIPCD